MLPHKKPSPTCLRCRDKHLKCDGRTPLCNRCAAADVSCTYVQSRRGRRGPPPAKTSISTSTSTSASTSSPNNYTLPKNNGGLDDDHDDYLVNLYYRHVHPAHPFLFPQALYLEHRAVLPTHLKRAVCFIASHHLPASSDQYYAASNAVFDPEVPDDAFKVQSLILVTLASYARFDRVRGNKALNAAINVAYQINLNSDAFAPDDQPLFRESWRRTWWELYSVAGLISLIGGTNTRLAQPLDMTLPCDCAAYNACRAPPTGNVRAIQDRFTADPAATTTWSSFAFRVEAMRILSMVLDSITQAASRSKRLAAEAAISSWLFSLPDDKRDGLKPDGDVDEVMSCAIMIIHLAGICLHLPQSPLALVGDFRSVCGNNLGHCSCEAPNLHRAAALRSARAMARLLTAHSDLSTLSPCFSCAVAYSAVVLLAEYSTQSQPTDLSEILQLELSALQSLGRIWPIACVVRSQLAAFTRAVMVKPPGGDLPESMDLAPPLLDEGWLQDLMSDNGNGILLE